MRNRLLGVAVSVALCAGLCPAPALAAEASAFDRVVERFAAKDSAALQRVDQASGNMSALFDKSVFSSGIMPFANGGAFPEKFDLRDGDSNGFGESLVTPVKLQNPWSTCWSFGTANAAESSIIAESGYYTAENLDLSELQVGWFAVTALPDDDEFYPAQRGEGRHWVSTTTGESIDDAIGSYRLDAGGSAALATSVLASGTGPLLEEYAPYKGKGEIKQPMGSDKWCYSPQDDWSLDDEDRYAYTFELENTFVLPDSANANPEGVEAIKGELTAGRATTAAIYADMSVPGQAGPSTYINPASWAHYTCDENTGITHLVSIVGWDNAYSRYLFEPGLTTDEGELDAQYFVDGDVTKELNEQGRAIADASNRIPSVDGAWIVKNSWGSAEEDSPNWGDWGIDGSGYFYLSYCDKSICMVETFDFDITASEAEIESIIIDQHDFMTTSGYNDMFASEIGVDDVAMANVFTASSDQMLRAVGVATGTPGTTVEVQVYRLNEGFESPVDGTPVLDVPETATFEYGGYHRIELREFGVDDDDFVMEEGQPYSVVVTQRAGGEGGSSYMQAGMGNSLNNPSPAFSPSVAGAASYSVGIVNPGESYAGARGGANDDYEWEDWSDVVRSIEASSEGKVEYDNFSIKAYSDPVTIEEPTVPEGPTVPVAPEGPDGPADSDASASDASALAKTGDRAQPGLPIFLIEFSALGALAAFAAMRRTGRCQR